MELNHLAIIMDGNRRWAVLNNRPSYEGHRFGADNLWKVIKDIDNYSINYLTLFVFSTENWKRSQKEILFLLALLEQFLDDLESKIEDYNYKIRFIGDFSEFSKKIQQKILYINKITKKKPGMTITLALNYGGRYDIVCAINNILKNRDKLKHIKQEDFKDFTLNASIPDPDLLIRTGGEKRLSNFLLWDLAYTELIFLPDFWPDFNKSLLDKCLKDYSKRTRKYGE
ncbi:polyprenyl diphosphate synthase [Candidatus Levibacter sp. Uisw_134_01]|uniref:polyprenyl diphosphate synthase n=1 Tax=Candidatus Levibacter sp. Uisw_134_01 TaxID=3230999 RepID=UPI003D41AC07